MFTITRSTFYRGFNIWQGDIDNKHGPLIATVLWGDERVLKSEAQALEMVEKFVNLLNEDHNGADAHNSSSDS